jgi:small-conductance mechanosensitive channel
MVFDPTGLVDWFGAHIAQLIGTAIIWLAAIVLTKVITIRMWDYLDKIARRWKRRPPRGRLKVLNKIVTTLVFICAAIITLSVWQIDVWPIIAAFGILGLAIGFAAKDTISNFIAGFILIIDRPFDVGDRVKIGRFIPEGEVIEIRFRSTRIRTSENNVVTVPNSIVCNQEVMVMAPPKKR